MKKIENASAVLGGAAVFGCSVEGSLPLSVQWKKDGIWIPQDPKVEQMFRNKEATLRILACEATHKGKYTCQVVNEAGQDTCSATLTVQGTCASNTVLLVLELLQQAHSPLFWCFRATNDSRETTAC